jgi:hypothetical protein
MSRIELIKNALEQVKQYTSHADGWRPGLVDIFVYNYILDMHENDAYDVDNVEWIWNDTPDNIMQKIIESDYVFDIEYGAEDLYETLRTYLHEKDFITHVDELEEEE